MWTRELRPMTREEAAEIDDLLRRVAGTDRRTAVVFITACAAGMVPALVMLLTDFKEALPPAARLGVIALAAGIGGLAGLWLAGRPDEETQGIIRLLKADLLTGLVEEKRATANDAVGAGAAYFVDVDEGEVMYIETRNWDAAKGAPFTRFQEIFPCQEFRLVRAPASGADLGFSCGGRCFRPSRELDPKSALLTECFLSDGDVFAGRLETLEADLLRFCGCAADPMESSGTRWEPVAAGKGDPS